ncbi:acetyltransferase (GNAT) family protein [Stackebrandtia albiflava]|uniref:Acetyltransferase (GNAT) family protein n=1 Tax=Stackebrandtia albiflava TaxID=406432 RepID=A0A562V255_9ACTN|nr:GNAT family N-acetyltransferase [Stackebrandtia albiflava]TWJ11913.1 acetyltransferase (GNAT) family protein [Stackebrandtia albiflava]
MQIAEFTPAHASAEELEQWREVLNAMTEADMPGEPRWHGDRMRDYLSITMPNERRLAYVARDDAGRIVGHANLLVYGGEFADTGIFEIFVEPGHRGSGVGRGLLRAVARRASREGLRAIGVEVIATTPAVGFYDRLGFGRAVVENRHLLRLADVDWETVTDSAGRLAAGYRLEYFTGGLPDHLMERYAATKVHLKAEPAYNVGTWRGSADARRLRDSLATLSARGLRPHLVVAIAEGKEAVVGLTELVVAAQRPTRGDQYDTVVAPEHRSYGLGMAMKARMLCELREAEPQLVDVQTWTSLDGDAMAHVDAELGFRNDVQWFEYEADVAELVRRLG